MRKLDEMREELNLGDYGEYLNDYRDSDSYICDAIMEIADNNTSVYYSDIMNFISDNPDALADAVNEGMYDPSHDYDIYRHGQAAEYMLIERDLYENVRDSILMTAIDFVELDLEIMDDDGCIPDELAELMEEQADNSDNNDRMDKICDEIREWYDANKQYQNEDSSWDEEAVNNKNEEE